MPVQPPLILTNATIHTMRNDHVPADTIALDPNTGRILNVGMFSDIMQSTGIYALKEIIDLRGATILPGFVDAHTHILATARDLLEIDLGGCRSEREVVDLVYEASLTIPTGNWIIGRHWNQNTWDIPSFPTKHSLDAAIPNHPVILWTHSQHAAWVNSVALQRGHITAETPSSSNGSIACDDQGIPNGMLFEGAASGIAALCEQDISGDPRTAETLLQVMRTAAQRGITGIATMEGSSSLRTLQHIAETHDLPIRVRYFLPVQQLAMIREIGIESGFGNDMIAIAGVKIFADGALGTRTAAVVEQYNDDHDNYGMLTTSPDAMQQQVAAALQAGLDVAIHAIGDRAVQVAIDGIQTALQQQAKKTAQHHCRIEHVQLLAENDIRRMADLEIVASVQPFHAVSDRDVADRAWHTTTSLRYPYATLAHAGVVVALGSDTPIETWDPWRIMHAAIARTDDRSGRPAWDAQEALTISEAVTGYTRNTANSMGRRWYGSTLAPGNYADLIIVENDPFTLDSGVLANMQVRTTIIGGRIIVGQL